MHEKHEDALVTIGIPSFNRFEGLVRITKQLQAQTNPYFRALISDNASPDARIKIFCAKISTVDHRFSYYIHSTNIGAQLNHNFLLLNITTPFFAFMADDDEINEDYVGSLLEKLISNSKASLAGPRGLRIENGLLKYEYESYSSPPSSAFQRLSYMLPMAFDKHWAFEQYWYGLFRVQNHPMYLSGDFKSTIFRLFWLAEQGEIVHGEKAIFIKSVTSQELLNHKRGAAYRRHSILRIFRDDHCHSAQQCIPITLQMSKIIIKSKNLKASEKLILIFRLYFLFTLKVIPCELKVLI